MSLIKILFQLFLIYMLYKLVFNFIIPVYRASRQMKDAMNKAQEQMRQQQSGPAQTTTPKNPKNASEEHDYIEYEEVR